MSDSLEDLKDLMPTERKSMWRTPEERRMSDLTRVLEWLERRQGKKKRALQVCTLEELAGRFYARLLAERIGIRHPKTKGAHFSNTGVSQWGIPGCEITHITKLFVS